MRRSTLGGNGNAAHSVEREAGCEPPEQLQLSEWRLSCGRRGRPAQMALLGLLSTVGVVALVACNSATPDVSAVGVGLNGPQVGITRNGLSGRGYEVAPRTPAIPMVTPLAAPYGAPPPPRDAHESYAFEARPSPTPESRFSSLLGAQPSPTPSASASESCLSSKVGAGVGMTSSGVAAGTIPAYGAVPAVPGAVGVVPGVLPEYGVNGQGVQLPGYGGYAGYGGYTGFDGYAPVGQRPGVGADVGAGATGGYSPYTPYTPSSP